MSRLITQRKSQGILPDLKSETIYQRCFEKFSQEAITCQETLGSLKSDGLTRSSGIIGGNIINSGVIEEFWIGRINDCYYAQDFSEDTNYLIAQVIEGISSMYLYGFNDPLSAISSSLNKEIVIPAKYNRHDSVSRYPQIHILVEVGTGKLLVINKIYYQKQQALPNKN